MKALKDEVVEVGRDGWLGAVADVGFGHVGGRGGRLGRLGELGGGQGGPAAVAAGGSLPSAPGMYNGGGSGNDGGEGRMHWLRGSVARGERAFVEELLAGLFGRGERVGYGLWGYEDSVLFGSGVRLCFDCSEERADRVHGGKVSVEVPGVALDGLSWGGLSELVVGLGGAGLEASRVDCAYDDWGRVVSIEGLEQAARQGMVSGFRTFEWSCRRLVMADQGSAVTGEMITFGRRGESGSGKFLRVYDKGLESRGGVQGNRWEAEFTGERAREAWGKVSACVTAEALGRVCGGLVGGCIEFREVPVGSDRHLQRRGRLSWWVELVGRMGKCVLRLGRRVVGLRDKVAWVERAVGQTLRVIHQVVGPVEFRAWFVDLVGRQVLRDRHVRLIEEAERAGLIGKPVWCGLAGVPCG